MCVVSFIGDHYQDRWKPYQPLIPNNPQPYTTGTLTFTGITREEFEQLKKEKVLDMKELLKKAKIYDEKNNEPDCEMADKVEFLKRVAEFVGVDLEEIFKPKQ